MKLGILVTALALAIAAPALAGAFDENDGVSNGGSWGSQPASAVERNATRAAMLGNRWDTRHTTTQLEQYLGRLTSKAAQTVLAHFRTAGQHGDTYNGSYGGTGLHSGCGGGCLGPSHPRSQ